MTDTQMMRIAIAVFNYAKTKCKHRKLTQKDLLKILHTVSQLLGNFVNIEMMKLSEEKHIAEAPLRESPIVNKFNNVL